MKMETIIRSIGGDFTEAVIEQLLRRSRADIDKSLKRIRRPQAAVGVVKSPLGNLLVAMTARGIALNHYVEDPGNAAAAMAKLRLEFDPVEDQRAVGEVGEEVNRYLSGEANALRQNVDLTLAGNPFQKKVLDKLQSVPRGALISYQALGPRRGPEECKSRRQCLHNNPVPIYMPCHRVISSDGKIGGYGGGAARKLQLLRSEGFALTAMPREFPIAQFGVTEERKFTAERTPPRRSCTDPFLCRS